LSENARLTDFPSSQTNTYLSPGIKAVNYSDNRYPSSIGNSMMKSPVLSEVRLKNRDTSEIVMEDKDGEDRVSIK
jgi:hypothetical protein